MQQGVFHAAVAGRTVSGARQLEVMPARGQKVRDEALYASSLVTSLRCFVTGLTGSGWRSTCRCWIRQRCCCRHHQTCPRRRRRHRYRCRRRRRHSGRRHRRHRHRGGCIDWYRMDRCRHRSDRHYREGLLRHLTDDRCREEVRCSPFRPRQSPLRGLRRSPGRLGSSSFCSSSAGDGCDLLSYARLMCNPCAI